MAQPLPEPLTRRRFPWSSRTSLGTDLAGGILLLMIEAALGAWKLFSDSMEVWAAQGDRTRTDASGLSGIAWLEHFLVVVLILAVVAALSRAPWTTVLQLLVAGAAVVLLVLAQHGYDQRYPEPPPPPDPHYTPCYSGSGRCH
ncbi:DUF6234 family protein [Streptomyces sp. NPDC059819]|uniref:DUF6234 family protein n=1 Tax=Streptomyces sp. NPDC059819 TaxID=3346963 RepID=UPI003661B9B3